ncbi:MAG: CsgG/HfaB family protein [Syntrophales bacterium]|nr:CsgG/HfaB family protein [Syntrophales bacterium]
MSIRKYLMILIGLWVLLGVMACGTSEHFKNGQDLMKQNRPEDAMVYFRQALNEDRENSEYKEALQQAEQAAAILHYQKALKAFNASSNPTIPDLERIIKETELARKLDPRNNQAAALGIKLKEKMKGLQDSLKTLYAQAEADMAKEDWLSAISKLRQVNNIYPNYEDTGNRLAKIEQDGPRLFYQQGIDLGKQEDWKMAAQAFKSAMDINPNYLDVARQYDNAKEKDKASYYDTEAARAIQGKNWQRAILLLEKATEYEPDNQERMKNLDELKKKVAKIYFENATRAAEAGLLSDAVRKLDLARTYLPSLPNDSQFKSLQKNLTSKLMDRAEKYTEKELWGNALVWLQKAETLSPNNQELFLKIVEVKDRINKRIRKSVAVFEFGSPSNNKDAGKIVADKLITYLQKNASGDLRIIEREKLESILREMQLGQTGISDVSAATVRKIRGIDTFIMGNVLQFSVKTTDSPSTGQAKVLVDEEDVVNQEYLFWQSQNPRPSAEDALKAPPRTVKKRNYQFVPYKYGSIKINSLIEISYKLVDTMSGENVVTSTIPGRSEKVDKYQDAVTMANIPYDPLELPTEAEVIDDLTNQKVSEMGQSVLKKFQSLEDDYLKDAKALQKRRNFEQAIEKFTDAFYDVKLKGITTSVSQEATELINKMTQNQ